MALRFITADERLAQSNTRTSVAVFGPAGVGKTRLLYTLPQETTICGDMEAGLKSVPGWRGVRVPIRTWGDAVDFACFLGGANPARLPNETYSADHYAAICAAYGKAINPENFQNIFFDSITVLSRLCMAWAQQQPEAFNKKGVPDLWGAYSLLAREFIRLITHLQHAEGKNVVFIGGLECKVDEFKRETWKMQAEGGKVKDELPFIVDQVITFSRFDNAPGFGVTHNPEKGQFPAFVCKQPNPWGLPGKTRGQYIEMLEPPHLSQLFDKINKV